MAVMKVVFFFRKVSKVKVKPTVGDNEKSTAAQTAITRSALVGAAENVQGSPIELFTPLGDRDESDMRSLVRCAQRGQGPELRERVVSRQPCCGTEAGAILQEEVDTLTDCLLPWRSMLDTKHVADTVGVLEKVLSSATKRDIRVASICATRLEGMTHLALHASVSSVAAHAAADGIGAASSTGDHDEVRTLCARGDVILIHNDTDVLVVSCRPELDTLLRDILDERPGAPSVQAQVAMEARRIASDAEDSLHKWLLESATEKRNPVHGLQHESAGVTADFGLHASATRNMHLMQTRPGVANTKTIRAAQWLSNRERKVNALTAEESRHFSKSPRMAGAADETETLACSSGEVPVPTPRVHSLPMAYDRDGVAIAEFEGQCRAAASDISKAYFGAIPGVRALCMVREELEHAERALVETAHGCPFAGKDNAHGWPFSPCTCVRIVSYFVPLVCAAGGSTLLYTKGSMSLAASKGWHDDPNGPSCITFWQNLTGVKIQKCVLVSTSGCPVLDTHSLVAGQGTVITW